MSCASGRRCPARCFLALSVTSNRSEKKKKKWTCLLFFLLLLCTCFHSTGFNSTHGKGFSRRAQYRRRQQQKRILPSIVSSLPFLSWRKRTKGCPAAAASTASLFPFVVRLLTLCVHQVVLFEWRVRSRFPFHHLSLSRPFSRLKVSSLVPPSETLNSLVRRHFSWLHSGCHSRLMNAHLRSAQDEHLLPPPLSTKKRKS